MWRDASKYVAQYVYLTTISQDTYIHTYIQCNILTIQFSTTKHMCSVVLGCFVLFLWQTHFFVIQV